MKTNGKELSMRVRTVSLVAAFACVTASTAAAATAYALQKSDFPAGATSGGTAPSIVVGTNGKDSSAVYNFLVAGHEEVVTSDVVVWKKVSDAQTSYRITVAGYTNTPGSRHLTLPAYGDQQVGEFVPTPAVAQVIVRKGRIVWRVTVQNCSTLSPTGCLHGRTPPKLKLAQATAELKTYARKQKARIGSG